MIDRTYYEGFEGDREIIFTLSVPNGETKSYGIWDGYFDCIIESIKPTGPVWDGFLYHYHLVDGWYDEDDWQVPDLKLYYKQLLDIDENQLHFPRAKEVLRLLRNLFQQAVEHEGQITMSTI